MLPGPFGYAERWDDKTDTYLGLAIERATNAAVVIDSDSVIIKPDIAEAHRPAPVQPGPPPVAGPPASPAGVLPAAGPSDGTPDAPAPERSEERRVGKEGVRTCKSR